LGIVEDAVVIDAKGLVLGRLASAVARRLLQGERVVVLNAERAVISGRRRSRVREAKAFLEVGHPRKGPYHQRRPDQILRRTVRGMLPRKKPRGLEAYRRLRVFIGVPEELRDREAETVPGADAGRLRCPYLTLGELAAEIGWKGGE